MPSFQYFNMQWKLLGIINVDFDRTDQLLIIIIFCIRQTLEKKWEYNEAVYQLFIDLKKAYGSVRREDLSNILTEFGIPMKFVKLIQMCLTETYNRVRVSKNLSDLFTIKNGLKQGDALSLLLFNFRVRH